MILQEFNDVMDPYEMFLKKNEYIVKDERWTYLRKCFPQKTKYMLEVKPERNASMPAVKPERKLAPSSVP